MKTKFGPAGLNLKFASNKNNKLIDFPQYISNQGLDAYEYQCGHGVRVKPENAIEFGEQCKKNSISISIHSPYYISLSSLDPQKRKNSVRYIIETAKIAKLMKSNRIILHSGSCAKISREKALSLSIETLKQAISELKNENLSDIIICPEVMGKTNQLGNVDEVIELCSISDNMLPCVDFGHLNARLFGSLKTKTDYQDVFNKIENKLGVFRLKNLHIHFSKIEFSKPGGEVRHLTFEDQLFGPDYHPLIEILSEKDFLATVICESAGTQLEDALTMKNYYNSYKYS